MFDCKNLCEDINRCIFKALLKKKPYCIWFVGVGVGVCYMQNSRNGTPALLGPPVVFDAQPSIYYLKQCLYLSLSQ